MLGVPVSFFFIEGSAQHDARLEQSETIELVRRYYAIPDERVRKQFLQMVKAVAGRSKRRAPDPDAEPLTGSAGSDDERVALVACNAILDRALGKPREQREKPPETRAPEDMSDQELEDRLVQYLVQGGLSVRKAGEVVRTRRDASLETPASLNYRAPRAAEA